MTRLLVSADAAADTSDILAQLEMQAGSDLTAHFVCCLREAVSLILQYPKSGPLRPLLGSEARYISIAPFILIYDYRATDAQVVILRIIYARQWEVRQRRKRGLGPPLT